MFTLKSITMLDLAELIWARDPQEGYIQGRITELGAHEYEVVPTDKRLQRKNCSIDDIFPSCDAKTDVDDNCKYDDREIALKINKCQFNLKKCGLHRLNVNRYIIINVKI